MTDMLIWLVVILPPVDWATAGILAGLSRRYPHILALRERAAVALATAIAASLGAIAAWVYLEFLAIPIDVLVLIIALALVAASVPSLVWLTLLALGHFKLPEGPK